MQQHEEGNMKYYREEGKQIMIEKKSKKRQNIKKKRKGQ